METTKFANRHIGIEEKDLPQMLGKIGVKTLDELIDKTIPSQIRLKQPLPLAPAMTEREFAMHIAELASQNKLYKTYIGAGWYDSVTPAVIQRNVFENPVWYTSYTPYQAEISQGRLEALLNFQTVVSDLTAMPLANCSLLDEATAAAEAATMMFGLRSRAQQKAGADTLFVDEEVFPQVLAVIRTRAIPQGMKIRTGNYKTLEFTPDIFGCIVQYPNNSGSVEDYRAFTEQAHAAGCKVAVDADIMALVLLTPPGEWGADIVFGSTQRLGIPMFYGGPSAAYFATRDEYKRYMPGRIIGLSKDKYGHLCYRMALQTREQHIKREKATSNICTAQALLATMSGFYAVYHGPEGLKEIAGRIHSIAVWMSKQLTRLGYKQLNEVFFDTLRLQLPDHVSVPKLRTIALSKEINLRYFDNGEVGLSIDEATTVADANLLMTVFGIAAEEPVPDVAEIPDAPAFTGDLKRTSARSLQPLSYGNRNDALHQAAGTERYFPCPLHDLTWFLHHETECRIRNAATQQHGLDGYASIGSGRPGTGLPHADCQSFRTAEDHYRICRSNFTAQLRSCRRIYRSAYHPKLSGKYRTGTP